MRQMNRMIQIYNRRKNLNNKKDRDAATSTAYSTYF